MLQQFFEMGFREILDIALVAFFLYGVILWMKRAKAGLALVGILMVGAIYILAQVLGLQLTAWIFQGFFAVFLIVVVVIFQADLRRLFERIALRSLRSKASPSFADDVLGALSGALVELARRRRGAIIVVRGRDPLERNIEGGFHLDGQISYPLLLSLFDPHSVGHDGAAILEADRISRFSVQLPLSTDFDQLRHRGTRHSAALGLSERTDALCIVVSEERGEISVARYGKLRELCGEDELLAEIRAFLSVKSTSARNTLGSVASMVKKNWAERSASVALALGLWIMFVAGSQGVRQSYRVGVHFDNIPSRIEIANVEPREVEVTLSGPRREFYLLDITKLDVRVDLSVIGSGANRVEIHDRNVKRPPGLSVLRIEPPTVTVSAGTKASS